MTTKGRLPEREALLGTCKLPLVTAHEAAAWDGGYVSEIQERGAGHRDQ